MKNVPYRFVSNLFVKYLSKWQIKLLLGVIAFAIVIAVVTFSQLLVNEIIEREENLVKLYSEVLKDFMLAPNTTYSGSSDMLDILVDLHNHAIAKIPFPLIVTDVHDKPYEPYEDWIVNVKFDPNESFESKKNKVNNLLAKMKTKYKPFLVKDNDGKILQKIYYSDSNLVDRLRLFPAVAIVTIAFFVMIGYIAFSSTRNHEQSLVWVGMAKEAAHQLGTPLSSLMAWFEIMRYNVDDPNSLNETIDEARKDLERLNTITVRFSKIGSEPEKDMVDVSELIKNVSNYFTKRLPHLGKRVNIITDIDDGIRLFVNADLIAWVFENLMKNGAEAIEDKTGTITVTTNMKDDKKLIIYVKDNGKGMTQKLKRQVFNPGFSTKKRGWGLGLSLCKRIIEEYHQGKIYIKDTVPGKGTTFAIELPKNGSNHEPLDSSRQI